MSQEDHPDLYPSYNQNSEQYILSGLYSADNRPSYGTDPYDYNLPEIFNNQSDTLSEEAIQQIVDDLGIINNNTEPITQFFLPAPLSDNIVYDPHIYTIQPLIDDAPTTTTITPVYHHFSDNPKKIKNSKKKGLFIRIYYNPNCIKVPYKYKFISDAGYNRILYSDHELLFSIKTDVNFRKLFTLFKIFMKGKIIHSYNYFNLVWNYSTEKLLEDLQKFTICYA